MALRGAVSVIVGLVAFLFPDITLAGVVILFGVFALLEGVFLVVSGIRSRREQGRWWMLIIQRIIGISAGVAGFRGTAWPLP